MTVTCSRCGRTWPRDPALEVECPKCGAGIGRPCVARRPSGHVASAAFAGISVHAERDQLALETVEGFEVCGSSQDQELEP